VLERNSTCSPWLDVLDLVQSNDADVLDSDGNLVNERFLKMIQEYQNSHPDRPAGISWRWALGLRQNSTDILLMTQALPCDLDDIEVRKHCKPLCCTPPNCLIHRLLLKV